MRILASVHLFYPQHCCGSEAMLLHIFRYLKKQGHECRVALHYAKKYNIERDYVYDDIPVMVGHPLTKIGTYEWADIIFTALDMTQYSIIQARTARRPIVHFIHNDIAYPSIMQSDYKTYVVYNSQWIADKIGYKQPGIVLYPPCDHDYYKTEGDPISREYITLISLNERKGGYLFRNLAKAMPDRKFMAVVGSYDNPGPKKLSQDMIIELLKELPNVTIVPNNPDILNVYRQTRLLVMPSDYESWGRTATEAMCSGIPVICTPTPGLKENCREAADYVGSPLITSIPGEACVDTGEVDDWVNAIARFDNEKYYREKSLLCKERAAELDPLKELQALEQFLYNVKSDNFNR